jgi:hypothetical protein
MFIKSELYHFDLLDFLLRKYDMAASRVTSSLAAGEQIDVNIH